MQAYTQLREASRSSRSFRVNILQIKIQIMQVIVIITRDTSISESN